MVVPYFKDQRLRTIVDRKNDISKIAHRETLKLSVEGLLITITRITVHEYRYIYRKIHTTDKFRMVYILNVYVKRVKDRTERISITNFTFSIIKII